uniref:non-specific serine/threonine protein kinase n=2 Tax=Cacopsylla melanoneura TaxID=428564 RepID=A0A8D8QHP3_9HEMI
MNTLKDMQNLSMEEPKKSKGSKKLMVPPTPQTSRLGYGTGVGVYSMARGGASNSQNLSPWALKKVERKFKGQKVISDRLKVESKILKSLSHPNIIGFRGEGKTKDGRICLAMETCGTSLDALMEKRREEDLGPFPPDQIFKVAEGLCSALHYLHQEKQLLHGDIKSFNVLIKGDFDQVKLCDFGTPVFLNKEGIAVDDTQEYVGTEIWSAPEVLIDDIISDKADIFSFGLTLWEMLSLDHPNIPSVSDSSMDSSTWSQDSDASIMECTSTGTPINDSVMEQSFTPGQKPKMPADLGPEYDVIIQLIDFCTIEDCTERPNAEQVLKFIQANRKK